MSNMSEEFQSTQERHKSHIYGDLSFTLNQGDGSHRDVIIHQGDNYGTIDNRRIYNRYSTTPEVYRNDQFAIMSLLYTYCYKDALDQVGTRFKGTCDWILRHDEYRRWREQSQHSILWYTALPGYGKSMMAKFLVEEAICDPRALTAYFSFASVISEGQKTLRASQAILYQLCTQNQKIRRRVCDEIVHMGQGDVHSVAVLWEALSTSISCLKNQTIILVIDNVDSCDGNEVNHFMRQLRSLTSQKPSKGVLVKVVILCRPYRYLQKLDLYNTDLPPSYHISVDNVGSVEHSAVQNDIEIYLHGRLTGIAESYGLDGELRDLLVAKLHSVANPNFLWACPVMDLVLHQIDGTRQELLEVITNIPPTIKSAYELILQRCRSHTEAITIFSLVIAAKTPLTLQEMDIFLALDRSVRWKRDFELLGKQKLSHRLKEVCGLALTLHNSRISLAYPGLKDFLLCTHVEAPRDLTDHFVPRIHTWEGSICLQKAHYTLGLLCVLKILAENQQLLGYHKLHPLSLYPIRDFYHDCTSIFRNDYADHNFAFHIVTALRRSNEKTCSEIIGSLVNYGLDLKVCDAIGKSLLHHVVCPNGEKINQNLLKVVIRHGGLVTYADNENFTCLHYAVLIGDESTVITLVDAGFSIDVGVCRTRLNQCLEMPSFEDRQRHCGETSKNGLSALHAAVYFGNRQMVSLLLHLGADATMCDEHGQTPLHLAVSRRIEGPRCSDIWTNSIYMPEDYWSECFVDDFEGSQDKLNKIVEEMLGGIEKDRIEIVSILCQQSLNSVNAVDSHGRTPLHECRFNGQYSAEDSIKILLHYKPDIHCRDDSGLTPLHLAARGGDNESVQAMVRKPQDLMNKDLHGRNALHHAATGGNRDLVVFMLDYARSQRIESSTDVDGRYASHYCFHNSSRQYVTVPHYDVLTALIDGGVPCAYKDEFGQDALALYLSQQHGTARIEILDLLARICDVHYKDSKGMYLIHHLAYSLFDMDVESVETLHAYGAPIATTDHDGKSVIHHAAIAGTISKDVLHFLKETIQLDPLLRDRFGRTALSYAEELSKKHASSSKTLPIFRHHRWKTTKDVLQHSQEKDASTFILHSNTKEEDKKRVDDAIWNTSPLYLLLCIIRLWYWLQAVYSNK